MIQVGPNIFTFDFYNESTEIVTVYSFEIYNKSTNNERILEEIDRGECQAFDDFVVEMEGDFGVHDVSFHPDMVFHGFTTYEVDPKQYVTVIEAWRNFFISLGFDVGPRKLVVGVEIEVSRK